jgi:hypothetical protein
MKKSVVDCSDLKNITCIYLSMCYDISAESWAKQPLIIYNNAKTKNNNKGDVRQLATNKLPILLVLLFVFFATKIVM